MNPLVFHIISGQSFFTGIVLLIVAAITSLQSTRWSRRVTLFAFVFGLIAILLSSTAIPLWACSVVLLGTLAWLVSLFKTGWRRRGSALMAASWLIAAAIEIPFHIKPTLSPIRNRAICVIGDSVTAGIGGDETSERWPLLLSREHQIDVQDISHMGETAGSALKRASATEITAPLVIVEIGGNDILGGTSAAQFETDLDALLKHLTADGRQIVMFELPLPPFFHRYGQIQRTLAARHNVPLIPKRVFLSVLGGSDSTLDTIHLSQSGHQRMAETVWSVIQSAFD